MQVCISHVNHAKHNWLDAKKGWFDGNWFLLAITEGIVVSVKEIILLALYSKRANTANMKTQN